MGWYNASSHRIESIHLHFVCALDRNVTITFQCKNVPSELISTQNKNSFWDLTCFQEFCQIWKFNHRSWHRNQDQVYSIVLIEKNLFFCLKETKSEIFQVDEHAPLLLTWQRNVWRLHINRVELNYPFTVRLLILYWLSTCIFLWVFGSTTRSFCPIIFLSFLSCLYICARAMYCLPRQSWSIFPK